MSAETPVGESPSQGEAPSDQFDLDALRRQDETEIRRLIEVLAPRIRRLVLRYGLPVADAEDVTMDVIVRLINPDRLAALPESTRIIPYALTIARNTVMQHMRRTYRAEAREMAWSDESVDRGRGIDALDSEEVSAERRAALERALAELGDSKRAIILMRYVEGLSTAEIAARMSVTEGTVRVRLHRVTQELQASLTRFSVAGGGTAE